MAPELEAMDDAQLEREVESIEVVRACRRRTSCAW